MSARARMPSSPGRTFTSASESARRRTAMSIRSCCCLRVRRRPRPSRHRRLQSRIRRRRLPPPSRLGRLRRLWTSFPSLLLRWPLRAVGGIDRDGSERAGVPGTTVELTAAHDPRRDSRSAGGAAGLRGSRRADARRPPSCFRRTTAPSDRVRRCPDSAVAAGRIDTRDEGGRPTVGQYSGAPRGASVTRGSRIPSCIVDLRPVR